MGWHCDFCDAKEGEPCKSVACQRADKLRVELDKLRPEAQGLRESVVSLELQYRALLDAVNGHHHGKRDLAFCPIGTPGERCVEVIKRLATVAESRNHQSDKK